VYALFLPIKCTIVQTKPSTSCIIFLNTGFFNCHFMNLVATQHICTFTSTENNVESIEDYCRQITCYIYVIVYDTFQLYTNFYLFIVTFIIYKEKKIHCTQQVIHCTRKHKFWDFQ